MTPSGRIHRGVGIARRDTKEDVDAYGNQLTNAVAQYSLDPAGSL